MEAEKNVVNNFITGRVGMLTSICFCSFYIKFSEYNCGGRRMVSRCSIGHLLIVVAQ